MPAIPIPGTKQPATTTSSATTSPTFSSWLVAWIIIIGAFWGLSKTRWGHTVLYGLLWGMILLLVVWHYQDIATTFQNAGFLQTQTTAINTPTASGASGNF